ncbi:MAG: hypothetical protein R6U32_00365 [Candidatus Woesearchaeota archaeon]
MAEFTVIEGQGSDIPRIWMKSEGIRYDDKAGKTDAVVCISSEVSKALRWYQKLDRGYEAVHRGPGGYGKPGDVVKACRKNAPHFGLELKVERLCEVPSQYRLEFRIKDAEKLKSSLEKQGRRIPDQNLGYYFWGNLLSSAIEKCYGPYAGARMGRRSS